MRSRAELLAEEAFAADGAPWDEAAARRVAEAFGLELTPAHWELIFLVRRFYEEYGFAPSMRPLVKYAGIHLGPEKGRSAYLLRLLPESPALLLARLAGLPRPRSCL